MGQIQCEKHDLVIMDWLPFIKVFSANVVWKLTNWSTAGRVLINAFSSSDENVRTIAGMLVVKRGKTALPLLREALGMHHAVAMVLAIMGDIGDSGAAGDVARFVGDPDVKIDKAARAALVLLHPTRGQTTAH